MNGEYNDRKGYAAPCDFSYQLTELTGSLQRFALSLTSNHEDARDLLQETFEKALKNREKFQEGTNLKAWTYTIMKNSYINGYRRRKNMNEIFGNPDTHHIQSGATGNMDPYSHMPEHADLPLMLKDIENEIGMLDDDMRIPFTMHVEGYKYREIADALNVKIGTVKSRIFFARKKLRESIGGGRIDVVSA